MNLQNLSLSANQPKKSFFILAIALLAILYITIDGGTLVRRFNSLGIRAGEIVSLKEYISKKGIFLFIHLVALSVFILLSLTTYKKIAGTLLLLLFIAITSDLTFFLISEHYSNLADINNMLNAVGNFSDAFEEYYHVVFKAALITLAFYLPILAIFSSKHFSMKGAGRLAFAFIILLSITYTVLASTKSDAGINGFPRGFSFLFGSTLISIHNPKARDTDMLYVLPVKGDFSFNNIIVIMDESVEGEEFSKYKGEFQAKTNILNFGNAFSGANGSASSNFFFRKACLMNGKPVQTASLFKLAKLKGYRTTYIDNQGVLVDLGAHNYMDASELAYIDKVFANTNERYKRDANSINQIRETIKENSKNFIYINKMGSHIPYETTIPPNKRASSKIENYRNSIKINGVDYIQETSNFLTNDSVLIYTSDHGQKIEEGLMHGSTEGLMPINEWRVPFLISTKNESFLKTIREQKQLNKLAFTHFDISELVRNLMGFRVKQSFSLIDKSPVENIEKNYCAYYGPPFGVFSAPPKCKVFERTIN